MPLGMEVGLGPDDFVLDGDPAPPPKGGRQLPKKGADPPIFGPCLLRAYGMSKMHPRVRTVETGRTYGQYIRVVRIGV